jgi:hypothetical protein
MSHSLQPRRQKLTILAKDPSVKAANGSILTSQVEIPAEELSPGPRGYRVQVVDYDASSGLLYPPLEYRVLEDGTYNDPFLGEEDSEALLGDPGFHAQNVYAIVMRTLARFEHALGRRVRWSFGGHQIQVAPHAFLEANAFYSKDDRALLFGYFPRLPKGDIPDEAPVKPSPDDDGAPEAGRARFRSMVFSCLSHDVVAHETTHALLDGLRQRYTDPSSADQAAFHEGFADIVALLSIFSVQDIVQQIIDRSVPESAVAGGTATRPSSVPYGRLIQDTLRESLVFALSPELGQEMIGRDSALRSSIRLKPDKSLLDQAEYEECHKRGEVLVAAVLNTFLEIWQRRIDKLREEIQDQVPAATPATTRETILLDRGRVVEEGAAIADQLLTMCIRSLDYCPPTDLRFSDFLSALLTADRELRPDDGPLALRQTLRQSFEDYGIRPTSKSDGSEPGIWEPPDCEVTYARVHLEPMLRDEDEMFRFVWENRVALGLDRDAYTRVLSVRPAVRVNPDDGFVLRETVAEYYQILNVAAAELRHLGIKKPKTMPEGQQVTLYGGGSLIFDEFGRLKFHVRNRLLNPTRQTNRLRYLWRHGHFEQLQVLERKATPDYRFARMHEVRFGIPSISDGEVPHDELF